jgi:methylenetetrahydrofolate--tRNA-(uracil-5-)-methyltransferase
VESAASGIVAGIGACFRAHGREPVAFPEETTLGALGRYISRSEPTGYQPTNVAFGLLPDLERRVRDRKRRRVALARRSLENLERFRSRLGSENEPFREAAASSG